MLIPPLSVARVPFLEGKGVEGGEEGKIGQGKGVERHHVRELELKRSPVLDRLENVARHLHHKRPFRDGSLPNIESKVTGCSLPLPVQFL